MAGGFLYGWGPVAFEVWPLNVEEVDHESASDWAPKEIAGAPTQFEWVGEEGEIINLRGCIYPYTRIGGMSEMEYMEAARRAGTCDMLVRGDGYNLGWFVCLRLSRAHAFLGAAGVGQVVRFEAVFTRVPPVSGASYFPSLFAMAI